MNRKRMQVSPNRWRLILSQYKITSILLGLICFILFYRGLIYDYPSPGIKRNPIDLVFDSVGYSSHLLLFSFDARQGTIVSDYHIRRALFYKMNDPYLSTYLQNLR